MKNPAGAHYQTALSYASEDFSESDPVRLAFASIVNYIVERPLESLNHLSFGMLRSAAKLHETHDEVLHRTIAYLTGDRANLLVLKYEFIMGDYEHELEEDEVTEFLNNSVFFDPRYGVEIPLSARFIYVFFRPNYAAFH